MFDSIMHFFVVKFFVSSFVFHFQYFLIHQWAPSKKASPKDPPVARNTPSMQHVLSLLLGLFLAGQPSEGGEQELGRALVTAGQEWRERLGQDWVLGRAAGQGYSRGRASPSAALVGVNSSYWELVTYALKEQGVGVKEDVDLDKITESLAALQDKVGREEEGRERRSSSGSGQECKVKEGGRCEPGDRFRSHSGRCNNLAEPGWGSHDSPLQRLLPSEYDDGVASLRARSTLGFPLPSPRQVSQAVLSSWPAPSATFSLMLMQWGQLVDHDLTHVPVSFLQLTGAPVPCQLCSSRHPACAPIPVPPSDPHFPNNSCVAYTRSLPGQQQLGPREQINQLTGYMDASMVYGSDECTNNKVRLAGSALLKSNPHPGRSSSGERLKPLLPLEYGNHECRSEDNHCFYAGDQRVNEQPGLTVLHTVLMREHNRLAVKLAQLNTGWDSERVYQEARRLVVALVQHITYSEFLPKVLGKTLTRRYSLQPRERGYYTKYDRNCNAGIFTEFATAAFRFGHSMISPNLTLMTEGEMMGRSKGPGRKEPLRNHFRNPGLVREAGTIDDILRGLFMMPMENVDSSVTREVRDHLFEERGRPRNPLKGLRAMDLVALNVQRGRDHGIPGYNRYLLRCCSRYYLAIPRYRQVCRLPRAASWAQLAGEIPRAAVDRMKAHYAHPDDVDLFTGLLSEHKVLPRTELHLMTSPIAGNPRPPCPHP